MSDRPLLGVGMVGHAFMGGTHSHAWRTAHHAFDLPLQPRMVALAGRRADAVSDAAERWGWQRAETDWRALVDSDDIDLIDICSPGDTHAEIAIAALAAGKHVLCEKPLANTLDEAEAMTDAAEQAAGSGVLAMVGFSYRRTPAIALARDLVATGRIGEVRQARADYLSDWLADPAVPMSWRLDRERAGSGALSDIGAHAIDLVQFISGRPVVGVSGTLQTFVERRPVRAGSTETAAVTVDDAAAFIGRLAGGALATFEATRSAWGRKNAIRVEVNGTTGSVAFDFEDMNVLHLFEAGDDTAGFRRIQVTEPTHPYLEGWWPAGHGLGYEHTFTHQVVDLVRDIAAGRQPRPSFADGLQVQRVLHAVETSAADGCRWQDVPA